MIRDGLVLLVVEIEDLLKVVSQVDALLTSPIVVAVRDIDERIPNVGLRPELGVEQDLEECLLLNFVFSKLGYIVLHLMYGLKIDHLALKTLLRSWFLFKLQLASTSPFLLALIVALILVVPPLRVLCHGYRLHTLSIPETRYWADVNTAKVDIDDLSGWLLVYWGR